MELLRGTAPKYIQMLLRENRQGSVLLVTSKGIYLDLSGQTIVLCSAQWGTVPIGITLEQYEKLIALHPEVGQTVHLWERGLIFPGGNLEIQLTWYGETQEIRTPKREMLTAMGGSLIAQNKKTGLAPLCGNDRENWNIYCKTAFPALTALTEGLEKNDPRKTAESVKSLLGLGTGLTPSADDVLCGMLYGLLRSRLSQLEAVMAMAETIKDEAPRRTNAISAAYLAAIAQGAPYERMEEMWAGMAGEGSADIRRLTEVGSNSGSEMLLGMLAAGNLLCRMEGYSYG